MTQRITLLTAACVLGATAVLAGCAVSPGASDLDQLTARIFQKSFRDEGIVKVAAMAQDDATRECSAADVAGKPLDEKRAKEIEAANLKTIQWPADGRFLGDWQKGEALAQSGRGLTFTDTAQTPNGGNCYNCHQLSPKEISFGTIGPSLYNYGKIRGVTDLASPAARPIVEYTWGKIWNAKAYNACSHMPRAGHKGILTPDEVRHLVALLLDPKSVVNQ
ncbi:MAG: sulfur oxidation c-type cytochrome SoxX [Burkholderiaceae bacterium]|jgi:sulfur-oxidizing protein SoxX|nr:sulfur oxidation c-type cytochrome SoxX [Betaproteobacteria bacterium]MBP6644582.1 sulfur oxidation c-type cytochrome SoxX [Burkholderiaceae bacterium]